MNDEIEIIEIYCNECGWETGLYVVTENVFEAMEFGDTICCSMLCAVARKKEMDEDAD